MASKAGIEARRARAPGAAFTPAERRILTALCLGTFVGLLTFVAATPFLPAIARDLHLGIPLLGQVVAAMFLLSALCGLIAGPLADRRGQRALILCGLAATAVCFLAFGLARNLALLLVAAIAGGFGNAAIVGPAIAVAGVTFDGVKLRRALGWTTACMAGSAIVGVPLLTAVGGAVGWRSAFIATGMIVIAIALLGAVWLPRVERQQGKTPPPEHLLDAYRPLLRHGPTLGIYAVAVLRAICWFGMLTYFGAFLAQELALTTGQVGIAYMLGGSGYFLGSLVAGGPLGGVPPRLLLIAGNLALALVMGLAYSQLLGPVGTVAMLPLAGFAGAFGWVAVVALLTDVSPAGAATTMTLHGSLFNLGAGAGGAIGGLLLGMAGYGALAIGLPLFGVAAAGLACLPARQAAPDLGPA